MKYSEKKKIEEFVLRIIDKIDNDKGRIDWVSADCNNARVELEQFLDNDLTYAGIVAFLPKA